MDKANNDEIEIMREFTSRLTSDLDYSVLAKHQRMINQLALLTNSYITVYNHATNNHVLNSNCRNIFFGSETVFTQSRNDIEHKLQMHPMDIGRIMYGRIATMRFLLSLPEKQTIFDYKLVNEYRVYNPKKKCIRVIEQFQALELDENSNLWLGLSILDVAPDQQLDIAKSQIINYRKGEIFLPPLGNDTQCLGKRELEILNMVKQGFYSKEISEKLLISVNTVNTHRRNILHKLNADNSIEAIKNATKLGLIS